MNILRGSRYHNFARMASAGALITVLFALGLRSGNAGAEESSVNAADASLGAGWLQRRLVGGAYRDLWVTPISVPKLDLGTFAGGLTPQFTVGGKQTLGLAMSGADGRSYTFRGVVKDLSATLPADFRDYLIDDMAQDQLAAAHPVGPLIAAQLAEAAGVPHPTPILVVMPDDPLLGQFREAFAGVLGTLEVYPTPASDSHPGFMGAVEILSSRNLWQRMISDPGQKPDARAYLRARLLDFLIGDWDRHAKQWRWAKIPGLEHWQPLPEDRDQAFASYQGLLPTLFRPYQPKFTRFDNDYPSPTALTLQGWPIHRWVLADLEREDWIEAAQAVSQRLSDEVIAAAVQRIPVEYLPDNAEELADKLQGRRDRLTSYALEVYEFLARDIDVHATHADERITFQSGPEGDVALTILSGDGSASVYFERQIYAAETDSIRIFARQGRDELVCSGQTIPRISIHVVGESTASLRDECHAWPIEFIERPEFERRQNKHKAKSVTPADAPWRRARDWGWRTVPVYRLGFSSSLGVVAGIGVDTERYRFGRYPYAHKHSLSGAHSEELNTFELSYSGTYQPKNESTSFQLKLLASGFQTARFYGLGNETENEGGSSFFRTEQIQYVARPSLRHSLSDNIDVSVGAAVRYSATEDDDDTLLNRTQPYGVGDFGEFRVFAEIELDTRKNSKGYSPGTKTRLLGLWAPELVDVESAYGVLEGEWAGFHALNEDLLFSVRLLGKKVFGTFPFHSAAYLGGPESLRGYVTNRFAGDASVLVNTELRYVLGHAPALLFRGEWGLLAFADAGRVWFDGEESDDWHGSMGGGVSLSTLNRKLAFSATVAQGEEGTTFFLQSGFSF